MIKINGRKFEYSHFPDGTPNMLIDKCKYAIIDNKENNIFWQYETNEEFMILYFIASHLQSNYKTNLISLTIPYFPNARMDRVKNNDEVFTLKYFANFINSMNFCRVMVLDVHSNVSLALINNLVQIPIETTINAIVNDVLTDDDIVFYPDEGSCKRYSDIINKQFMFGIKKRDWRTGKIQSLQLCGDVPTEPFDVLIIDDICSKGGTFYHSAKALKEVGAKNIYLYVTHCEDTILNGELINSGLVKRIYTTNSVINKAKDNPLIETIEIF